MRMPGRHQSQMKPGSVGWRVGLVVNASPLGAEAEKGAAQRIKLKDQTGPALAGPCSPEGSAISPQAAFKFLSFPSGLVEEPP